MTIQRTLLPEGTVDNHHHGWTLIALQLGRCSTNVLPTRATPTSAAAAYLCCVDPPPDPVHRAP
jgi:hypothetical protein